ncbi:MAG: hypothetical protein UDB11_07000, partial [Peptococcaceae bacterium]|nr:hypothetical protein [Peptococcaceae bacterium]
DGDDEKMDRLMPCVRACVRACLRRHCHAIHHGSSTPFGKVFVLFYHIPRPYFLPLAPYIHHSRQNHIFFTEYWSILLPFRYFLTGAGFAILAASGYTESNAMQQRRRTDDSIQQRLQPWLPAGDFGSH